MGLKLLKDPFKLSLSEQIKDKKIWQPEKTGKKNLIYNRKSFDPEKDKSFLAITLGQTPGKTYDPESKLIISGIANANIIDRMDEVLDPRGLDITNYIKNPQILAHHCYWIPIGQAISIEAGDDGVKFSGWIGDPKAAPLTDMQKEIRHLIAQGILKTVSVGFIPHKIKEAELHDDGIILSPITILSWELLEISVVAVPANQGSIFEMKSFQSLGVNMGNKKTLEEVLAEIQKQSTEIQTIIFEKESFSKEDAIKWLKDHDFKYDDIVEKDTTFHFRQQDPELFDPESFRTIEITKGIKAIIGKKKSQEGKQDESATDDDSECLLLLRNIDASVKRNTEMLDKLVSGLLENKNSQNTEGKPKPEDDENEPKKLLKKALDKIEALEKNIAKLSEVVNILSTRL
jgi:HK97 family phage prohead protease